MTSPAPSDRTPEWTPERAAAERKRIMRQTWAILAVIAIVIFGVIDVPYEQIQGASGRTYRVVDAGRRMGTDWSGLYVRYLTEANDHAGIDQEFADLSRTFSAFAERHEDVRLEVGAVRRLFRYGYFHVDETVTTRYRRDENGLWRPE